VLPALEALLDQKAKLVTKVPEDPPGPVEHLASVASRVPVETKANGVSVVNVVFKVPSAHVAHRGSQVPWESNGLLLFARLGLDQATMRE